MAINSETGVDFQNDRFVCKWIDPATTAPAPMGISWPVYDGGPIQSTTLKYYRIINTEPPILPGPQFIAVQDTNYTFLDVSPYRAGYPAGTCTLKWGLGQRDKESQLNNLEQIYRAVIDHFYPPDQIPQLSVRVSDATMALARGLTLTAAQLDAINTNQAMVSVLNNAETRKAAITTAINTGASYDLFDGWDWNKAELETAFGYVVS